MSICDPCCFPFAECSKRHWGLQVQGGGQRQQRRSSSFDEGWRAPCTGAGMWSTDVARVQLALWPATCRLSSASQSPKMSSPPPRPLPCGSSGTPAASFVLSSPGCWCFTQSLWWCLWCYCPPKIWSTALSMEPCSTCLPSLPSPHISGPCALTL